MLFVIRNVLFRIRMYRIIDLSMTYDSKKETRDKLIGTWHLTSFSNSNTAIRIFSVIYHTTGVHVSYFSLFYGSYILRQRYVNLDTGK